MRNHVFPLLLAGCVLLASCTSGPNAGEQDRGNAPPSPPTEAAQPSNESSAPPGQPPASSPNQPQPVVVLDPGHNGGNAENPAEINRKVPAGRGVNKPCNTTGTSTNDGYPEHAFTFDVATRVAAALTAKGIAVALTRKDDESVGPCVDQRAAAGNSPEVAAAVSIHADGSASNSARGFHVAYSSPPLNPAQGEPAARLATVLRDRIEGSGFERANYIGSEGLAARDDLAGLNLSERPAALVECGNMRNPDEAAQMSTPDGRQRYGDAIASGILNYLGRG